MEIINLSNIKASTVIDTRSPEGVSFRSTLYADSTNSKQQVTKQEKGLLSSVLQGARKDSGISMSEAAQDLFIKKRQLEAIEDENFEALPPYTFARGFAIKYGHYLGLDAEKVGESFDRVYPAEMKSKQFDNVVSPVQPMGTVNRDGKLNININPSLLIASVAVIALAVSLMRIVSEAENQQNAPKVIEESISSIEQRQGASLTNTYDLHTVGSSLAIESKTASR